MSIGATRVPVRIVLRRGAGGGAWFSRVGLPAKSGVSGNVIMVVPGRFGVAVYSPPLDPSGNSVRGVAALRDLSKRWGLHILAPKYPEEE